jgi:Na+-transporting methylmalonyl-CoA/oxaloacetate decarboxylase gamma subunit
MVVDSLTVIVVMLAVAIMALSIMLIWIPALGQQQQQEEEQEQEQEQQEEEQPNNNSDDEAAAVVSALPPGGELLSPPVVVSTTSQGEDAELVEYRQNLTLPDRLSGFMNLSARCAEPTQRPIGANFELSDDYNNAPTKLVVSQSGANATNSTEWLLMLESMSDLPGNRSAYATVSLLCLGPSSPQE